MRDRRLILLISLILIGGLMFCGLISGRIVAHAQQQAGTSTPTPAPPNSTSSTQSSPPEGTFRVETREVLVDTVVTDKKGNYIRDLTQKDFKVWEDGKEQVLSSFAFEESAGGAAKSKPRYMVLFFDNSTMNPGDQIQARNAATKFIDANAGPGRLIAIADFGGSVRISQDFTPDADRLKEVVKNLQGSSVSPNAQPMEASLGAPSMGFSLRNAESDFGIRSVLLALRSLAKGLSGVPGRKTLVMLTAGFPLNPEFQSELTAVIDTCNKANVAIYPIDVRGLVAGDLTGPHSRLQLPSVGSGSASLIPAAFHSSGDGSQQPLLRLAAFAEAAEPLSFQHGGGGGGGGGGHGGGTGTGGGGTGGGGTGGGGKGGGGTGGTGGTGGGSGGKTGGGGGVGTAGLSNTGLYNTYNQPRVIVPPFPPSASNNQQVLYELADGTGGFVILNTNDLLGGLERIAKDSNQYYLLGYRPTVSAEGSCHTLKVKVERGGTNIRARSGYCNSRQADLLAGSPVERDLETRGSAEMKGNVSGVMQAPFFYTSPNTAQVHLAVEIPASAVKFEKVKGKPHAALNILGIAYKKDESIAARFSDTVNLDLEDKKQVEEFQKQPFHYENQFGIASGEYKLRVVFSSGNESFGKIEMPLAIDTYLAKDFSLSGVALSNNIRPVASIAGDLDSQLLEDRTPLAVSGIQVIPSASNRFKKTDPAGLYAEIYEPLMNSATPPAVAFEMKIVERKTGQEKSKVRQRVMPGKPGNPVIALGLKLPVASLDPGSYRVELIAGDAAGNKSKTRSVDFEVE